MPALDNKYSRRPFLTKTVFKKTNDGSRSFNRVEFRGSLRILYGIERYNCMSMSCDAHFTIVSVPVLCTVLRARSESSSTTLRYPEGKPYLLKQGNLKCSRDFLKGLLNLSSSFERLHQRPVTRQRQR